MAKSLLGGSVQRLATIFQWRPDKTLALAEAVEQDLAEYTKLVADAAGASACARLVWGLVEMSDAGTSEVRRAVMACQQWTDKAYELLQALLGSESTEDPTGEVIEILGASTIVALRPWTDLADGQRFVDLVNRRQGQLEVARCQIADRKAEEAAASAGAMIERAILGACRNMLADPDGSPKPEIDQATALLIRHFIHQLLPRLWDREVTAEEVLVRLESGADDVGASVQSRLDWLETALIGASLGEMSTELRRMADSSSEGDGASVEALLALAAVGPLPSPGHLAAAIALNGGGPAAEVEQEVRDLLSSVENMELGSKEFEVLKISSIFSAVLQMHAGAWVDLVSLRSEVWRLLESVCMPLVRLDQARGARLVGFLFLSVAEQAGRWRPEELQEVLGWIDEAETMLKEGGAGAAPVLALARAEVALKLAARDAAAYPVAHSAARAFVRHIEADPDLPDEGTAFAPEQFVRALRLLAVSEQVGIRHGLIGPDEDGIEQAKVRLRELAEDPVVGDDVREQATRYLAEVEMVGMMEVAEFSEMLSVEWDEELLDIHSVGFLLGFLQVDESDVAAVDPDRVQRAIAGTIAQTRDLGVVGASEGAYLQLVTEPWARARMKMGAADALALGKAAADALDATSADAAVIALDVVLNLADLVHDPASEAGLRELAEGVAERFLPAVLESSLDHSVLPRFMASSAGLALNLGSVRREEVFHRLQVSFAAHLLAVAGEDQDGAGMAAYMAAELCRLSGQLVPAERWMGVYDSWREKGALADQRFEVFRQAIEFDRGQLHQALAVHPPNTEADSVFGAASFGELDASSRMAILAVEIESQPEHLLDEDDEAALGAAASQDLPPLLLLHQWNLALAVCARASQSHPRRDLLAQVTAEVGRELLTRKLPDALSRTAVAPVLETLVEAAISVGDAALARLALGRLAATLSELFLSAGLGSAFLSLRPTTGSLRNAALQAFERADLRMALEIAETGRMKLLSSLASGGPQGAMAPTALVPEVSPFVADRLVAVVERPDSGRIEAMVHSDLDAEQLTSAVRALVLPWVRLGTSHGGDLSGRGISDEIWEKALIEPSLDWLGQAVGDRQLLVYPFIGDTFIGAAILTRKALFSFLQGVDELPDEAPEADLQLVFGGELRRAILAHLEEDGLARPDWDIRLVAWDAEAEEAAQRIGAGFWLAPLLADETPLVPILMPTARLLEMEPRESASPPEVVSFLGDPTLDLPGPWIEGIAWSNSFGAALKPYLGGAATREAALTGLRESDLVVFSGHTLGEVGDDGFGLRLADGLLTHSDLLDVHGEVRASTAILSCCSAASISRSVKAEVVGIVTTLMALGVRQILAPLVPIDDPAAGVVGARLAVAVAAGCDLRQALLEAGRDCLAASPPPVSAVVPGGWVDLCPHTPEALQATLSGVSQRALVDMLRELSVFGGGR